MSTTDMRGGSPMEVPSDLWGLVQTMARDRGMDPHELLVIALERGMRAVMETDIPQEEELSRNLCSIERACELLGVKRRTVLTWLSTGKLTGVKIGRTWRVDRESIDALFAPGGAKKG